MKNVSSSWKIAAALVDPLEGFTDPTQLSQGGGVLRKKTDVTFIIMSIFLDDHLSQSDCHHIIAQNKVTIL